MVRAAAEQRAAAVARAAVDPAAAVSGAEHVVRDVVVLVDGHAVGHGDDGHPGLVQHLGAVVVLLALLAPAYDGAVMLGRGRGLAGAGQTRQPSVGAEKGGAGQLQQGHVVINLVTDVITTAAVTMMLSLTVSLL